MTYLTEQDREKTINKALEAYKEQKENRTLTLNYRGQLLSLPVIRVTTTLLLLNHDNNRLRAQLDGHPQKDLVQNNPTSMEAQKILQKLLAQTDEFKELKSQLRDLGQQEPGLTTRNGLLINGNTRLSALLELEAEGHGSGIDVAVLPQDLTSGDILEIEMTLQMTSLIQQKYSFTNELLLMKRYKDTDKSNKDLAKKMGWQRKGEQKVIQFLRILMLIEEVKSISESPLPYSVFDSKKQFLIDLDEKYQVLKSAGDVTGAESMKWSRLTAMFLGLNKDQVRAIDEDFIQLKMLNNRLLEPEFREVKEHLEKFKSTNEDIDDHGIFDDSESQSNFGHSMKSVFSDFINSEDSRNERNEIKKDIDGIYATLSEELLLAAKAKISEENYNSMLLEPAKVLREVRREIDEIREKIPEISSAQDFRSGNFKWEIDELRNSLKRLEDCAEEHF